MSSKSKILNLPLIGRLAVVSDRGGEANGFPGGLGFHTNVSARLIRNGQPVEAKKVWEGYGLTYRWLHRHDDPTLIDLGSGLVTDIGAQALANEAITLASPSGARINTLFLANWHASGTGATAAAATDFKIQTISTNGGQTPVAGTQSTATSSTGAVPKYQTVATIAYTGTEAVTEWGLFTSSTLSSTTGTPFTAATATTWTDTGSAQTASSTTVQGLQQTIVIPGTTAVYGLNQTNTTHVATLWNNGTTGWFNQSNGAAGSTPGGTEAFTIRPIMWDHKVFSAINVVNGDSIQFTYTLTVTSGG
jgi:hypothetical protein